MNKKLALKISKHPLIKKLMEDRTIPKSIVARLIVEEMDIEEAATGQTASAKKNLNTTLQKINKSDSSTKDKIKAIQGFINNLKSQPGYYYTKYDQLEDDQKEIYNTYVSKIAIPKAERFIGVLKQLQTTEQNSSPEQIQQAEEKVENQVGAALEKESENEQAVIDKVEQTTQTSPEDLVNNIASVIVDMNTEQEFLSTYEQNAPAALDFVIDRLPEEQVDVLKTASEETQQKVVKAVADELEPQTEPEPPKEPEVEKEPADGEPKTDEDPEKFDVNPEALQTLISVSEEFIEEFYEKALLRDQGKLVRNVLDQLVKITEKEELEKAAQRRPQPKPEEEKPVQEQQQNPSALRNIQVDLKSFIKLAKRSKEVLQRFDEASDKGKVIGSSLKKKFMEMLAQLQENIRDLVQDISKLNLVQEAKDTSEIEKKWDAIEKGYNDASRALSNIIAAGSEEKEAFDMEKNVGDAYNALMSISHFFPSVNPFGKKTSQDMKKYSEQYGAAIKDVKSVLRDVLELSQGQGGRSTASNAIKALKEFSGQIQSIFDVKSNFDDVVVQPNERAAQGESQAEKEKPDKNILDIPESEQEKIVDIIKADVESMDNPTDFWNKPLEDQVDSVLKIPELQQYKVKYFDAEPIEKKKEGVEGLLDYLKDEVPNVEDTTELSSSEEINTRFETDKIKERINNLIFEGKEQDLETRKGLALAIYVYLKSTIAENYLNEIYYQKIPQKFRPDIKKFDKIISTLSDQEKKQLIKFHKKTLTPDRAMKLYEFLKNQFSGSSITKSRFLPQDIYSIFLTNDEMLSAFGQENPQLDEVKENKIATKLKPLIREMLNKGK